jgi:hypothetical protein
MVQIAGETVIRAQVEVVFETLADPRQERNCNDRVRAAEMPTPGPITVGSRFEQQVRGTGRTDRATIEVTGYERPSRLALMINTPVMVTSGNLHFEEVLEGTHARYAWEMRARGVARLFEPALRVPVGGWSAASGKVSDGSWRWRRRSPREKPAFCIDDKSRTRMISLECRGGPPRPRHALRGQAVLPPTRYATRSARRGSGSSPCRGVG